jgi:hypothetical protein
MVLKIIYFTSSSPRNLPLLLKKLKIKLSCDPAIPLLGIHLKECKSGYNKDPCTPMFIAALLTMVKL